MFIGGGQAGRISGLTVTYDVWETGQQLQQLGRRSVQLLPLPFSSLLWVRVDRSRQACVRFV